MSTKAKKHAVEFSKFLSKECSAESQEGFLKWKYKGKIYDIKSLLSEWMSKNIDTNKPKRTQ